MLKQIVCPDCRKQVRVELSMTKCYKHTEKDRMREVLKVVK